jgi:hypothetical protein
LAPNAPQPLSSDDLLSGPPSRELNLLAGKDGVGKTSAVVSMAAAVQLLHPDAQFFVIDTENKFKACMRSFGDDAPRNIVYYPAQTMNHVTEALDDVLSRHAPGDWCACESMSRVWERAQDLGYQAITGQGKADYMEKRRNTTGQKPPVTPRPEDLWSIVKGAHDGAFLDVLSGSDTLNVLLTTTVSKPPKDMPNRKENTDRKDFRAEHGIDLGLDGAPRLPYYVETLLLLELKAGAVNCRVLRDNNSRHDVAQIEFAVSGRKNFGMDFLEKCRP